MKKVPLGKKIPTPVLAGSIIATAIGSACLIKEQMGGPSYTQAVNAENKVVIVTGANTGIGKQTAWQLAKRGAKVYMACRDLSRCEKAREEIVLDTNNKYVYCRKCDLASLESVRKFVKQFKAEETKLNVLINNAGVMRCPKTKTKDGFELQLGVNHLGHFLLTNLLLDTLKSSAPSRIINVSSVAHLKGIINKEDLNSEKEYDPAKAYYQSKLANVLFTKELAKRLENSGVTVNAVHPGIVDTEIIRHMGFFNSWFATILVKPFVWPFVKSPRQGSQTILYLALSPKVSKVTGQYYKDYEKEKVSELAEDPKLAKWLWEVSAKWTRLSL